jgi:NTP pyrophosphatase (non-canonical NTP hydrolase)
MKKSKQKGSDYNTDIESIKGEIIDFVKARHWTLSHNPKDLSIAISIEVAELLELFLFEKLQDIDTKIKNDLKYKERIAEELADVLIYSLELAHYLEMDVTEIIRSKMQKNGLKYPLKS